MAKFLTHFGKIDEAFGLRHQISEFVRTKYDISPFNETDFIREDELIKAEIEVGWIREAYARSVALLSILDKIPDGAKLGRGSYAYQRTLMGLAMCLMIGGKPDEAELRFKEALEISDKLLKEQPYKENYIQDRSAILTNLGNSLAEQGKYLEARHAYEMGLAVDRQLNDFEGELKSLFRLGMLFLEHEEYAQARPYFTQLLEVSRKGRDKTGEADALDLLSRVARGEGNVAIADKYFQEANAIVKTFLKMDPTEWRQMRDSRT